ncbi:MAG: 5-methylthioadenosine/S-adenosylhomocysteine deaminase [Candidatus Heimdallarchaeota archaeon LC_3]|nr:MAG: 5-methylthioadenosine/S-adenosylhomocysteine deaminase [Candidatus Heimdallarchaeota archaeon LC_3]
MDILLKNIKIISEKPTLTNIAIEDQNITAIGPNVTIPSPEYTITGKRFYISPALMNAHTHLPMTLLRGYSDDLPLFPWLQKIWALERHFTKESCSIGAELAFLEMIKSGCGGFADFYFNEDSILPVAEKSGLRGVLGAGVIEGAFLEQGGEKSMLNEAKTIASKLENQSSLIKAAVAPHAPHTCSEETLQKCLDLADKYNIMIIIHASETREDVINMQKTSGYPPIEWLDKQLSFFTNRDVLAVHCVWIQQREIEILANHNAGVAYCAVSGQKLAYGGLAPVPEMISAGVTVCVGTDGTASNNTLDMVREMRSAINLISHNRWNPGLVTAPQILDMASRSFRKRFFKIPSLTEGAPADISIFDFNTPHTNPIHNSVSTLVYSANGSNTHSLIVNGKLLMLNGVVQTLNEERVIENAEIETQKIKDRAKKKSDIIQ